MKKNRKSLQFFSLMLTLLIVFACRKPKVDPDPPQEEEVQMSVGKFIDEWTCSINPGKTSNFDIGEFGLWVPDPAAVSNLKAVLVLALHSNSSALGLVYEKEWQDFAKANNVALLAVHLENLRPITHPDQSYSTAGNGSGQALLMALEAIAKRNNIPKVALLPFLFRGYSAGGMYSYNFSAFQSKRVVAFANIRGWRMSETATNNNSIPALILIAELDTQKVGSINPVDKMKQTVKDRRKQNALWSYAIEPGADHEADLKKSDELARLFFSSALKQRIITGSNELNIISETSGWLGNNDSLTSFSYDTYPFNKKEASWLIDEQVATAWKTYQKK